MERSGSCNCGAGKPCHMHEGKGCPNKCNECKCGCKNSHPCKECKTDKHPNNNGKPAGKS